MMNNNSRQIDINLVYKEAHGAQATLMNTIEMYHDQTIKLMIENKAQLETIALLQKQLETMTPKVPNKTEPKK